MSADSTIPVEGESTARPELFGWYRTFNAKERRTFWACFVGWGVDGMDLQSYSFVIPTLIGLWGMTRAEAGMLGTATLLASSVGGWLGGILADRYGRVRTIQITVLWFAFFTFACAFTNSYNELLIGRILQGMGFGAEWVAGAALVGEIANQKHRGTVGGTVHSAWAVGWAAAALLYGLLFTLLPPEIAWRALFAIGLLPAALAFFVRRYVDDSALFEAAKQRVASGVERRTFLSIFAPEFLRSTILGAMLSTGILGGGYAVGLWLPTYLKTVRNLSVLNTTGFLVVTIVASFIGYVAGAYSADWLGRRYNFMLFAVCSGITVVLYMLVPIDDTTMLFLGFPLGFFSAGSYSGVGATLNELFPTAVRGSGIGFCFNFGRAMGAVFPFLVGALSAVLPLGEAIGIFTVAAYSVVVVAAFLLPETNGRALKS